TLSLHDALPILPVEEVRVEGALALGIDGLYLPMHHRPRPVLHLGTSSRRRPHYAARPSPPVGHGRQGGSPGTDRESTCTTGGGHGVAGGCAAPLGRRTSTGWSV